VERPVHAGVTDDDLRPVPATDSVHSQHWFPGTPAAVGLAREWVARVAASSGHSPLAPTVELLVSELATNAVRHANGNRFSVEFDADGLLLVAVCDSSTRTPKPRRATAQAEDGRGLAIVDALADRWGAEVYLGGKCVWFQLEDGPPPATGVALP
jgi:anti-sigma regulatory factor (Ser/Thr protein kinase)